MPARTTTAAVALIVGEGPSTAELTAFIDDASAWVDANLVGACDSLSDAILTSVEKYLAAHFVSLKYPVTSSEKIGDVSESYVGRGNQNQTSYLRMAASFDPCGVVTDRLLSDPTNRVTFAWRVGDGYDKTGGGG